VIDLVGRDEELRELQRLIRRGGALVSGSAGAGKTRVAAEIARLHRPGGPVLWARGSPNRSEVPLGAFAELTDGGMLAPAGASDLADIADALRAKADSGAAMLVVADDVHAFDTASLEVLAHLVAADDVAVLATVRSDEELSDLAALALAQLPVLELGPLDDTAVATLAAEVAGAPVAPVAVSRLQRWASGNPLFVAELTRDAAARGTLQQDRDGLLRFAGEPEPPAEVVALLAARVGALEEEARDVLELLTLAQPLSLTDAGGLVAMGLLERLDRDHLVTVDRTVEPARVTTAHPLLGEVVLASLPAERHRAHCARLVGLLRDRPRTDPVALARWHLDSGADHDPGLLLDGATAAASRFDAELAATLARAAAAAGAGPEADLVLGEALTSRPVTAAEAEEVLAHLAPLVADDEALRTRAVTARARNLLFGLGQADLAAKVAGEAANEVGDPSWHAELRATEGLAAMLLGDCGTAAACAEGVRAGGDVDDRAVVTVLTVSTLGRVMLGRLAGVEEDLDEARTLLTGLVLRDHLALADLQLDFTRNYLDIYGGRVERALERCSRAVDESAAAGEDAQLALWLGALGHAELIRGELGAVVGHGAEADALLATHDVMRVRTQGICQRGVAAAGLGLREEAARAREQAGEVDPDPPPRVAVHVGRLDAWVLALDGHTDAALDRLLAAAEVGRDGQHPVWAALALHDGVVFGRPERVASELGTIADEVDAELVLAMAEHARAAAERDAASLRRIADRLWSAGAALASALALLDAADVVAADSDADVLRLAAWRRVPEPDAWAVRGRLRVPSLTEREQQIAERAADGFTSRDIADRLVVSQRTVDNHLASVYRKLGLAGRAELRAVLATPGDARER
jgi:DNA-binding CsgD family transcriptional regulator